MNNQIPLRKTRKLIKRMRDFMGMDPFLVLADPGEETEEWQIIHPRVRSVALYTLYFGEWEVTEEGEKHGYAKFLKEEENAL